MTRDELRAAMPLVTAFGDDMLKHFPEMKPTPASKDYLIYYSENGIKYGKRGAEGVIPVIQERFEHLAVAKSKRQTKTGGM